MSKKIQPSPAATAAISTPAITPGNVLDTDTLKIPSLEIGHEGTNSKTVKRRRPELVGSGR